ncbi:MAG: methyltransferase [Chitinophagaceae bacterium]|nr:methyltransferase [Chitinophagaceae bacterium]
MPNDYFQFKQFLIRQDKCAMKVTTDGCLFGAWVANTLEHSKGSIRMLDVGAGTGLLTLMAAQFSDSTIDAIEMDSDAAAQARDNCASSPWSDRIKVYTGDAKEFHYPTNYDAIISNPPFYENELQSPDSKRTLAHHGGLSLEELLYIIKTNLAPSGHFFLLLPNKRISEIEPLIFKNHLSIIQKTRVRQSVKHDYFRVMIRGSHKGNGEKQIENEIAIKDEQQQYTPDFLELLKPFYLQL